MPFERPRVRAEGPGGPDVKQGARIACMDCRLAKIRCSAPTDGTVPCRRCARHGRECVFEKHRRGRKPGRTNNAKAFDHGDRYDGGEGSRGMADMGHHDGTIMQHQRDGRQSYEIGSSAGHGGHPSSYPHMQPSFDVSGMSNAYGSSAHQPYRPHEQHHSHPGQTNAAGASISRHNSHMSTYPQQSSPSGSSWRQAMPAADDPRLRSPRSISAMRNSSGKPNLQQYSSHSSDSIHRQQQSSSNSHPHANYMRPSSSPPPQMRRVNAAHPSYISAYNGEAAGAREGKADVSKSLASSFIESSKSASSSPPSSSPATSVHHSSSSVSQRHFELHLDNSNSNDKRHAHRSDKFNTSASNTPSNVLNFVGSRYGEPTYSPPSSGLPPHSLTATNTPGRSWLDFPTPGSRSLLSPSHLMMTSISTFPTSSGSGSLPTAWPGSAVTSPHKRKGPTDYFAGAVPLTSQSNDSGRRNSPSSASNAVEAADTEDPAQKKRKFVSSAGKEDHSQNSASTGAVSTSSRQASALPEEDEEQIDHMNEDEVGGVMEGNVLSTPLRLLAHASDAALALRQAKGDAEGHISQRSTVVGAATMGLVSLPVPSLPAPRKWLDSGRLPSMAIGLSGLPNSSRLGNISSGLLPKLTSIAQRREPHKGIVSSSALAAREHQPIISGAALAGGRLTSLGSTLPRYPQDQLRPLPPSLGRSRSYTAVENAVNARSSYVRSPETPLYSLEDGQAHVAPVTQTERRAEVLGIHTAADGRQVEVGRLSMMNELSEQAVTATTLDPGAWEYRDGRVRSRKSVSAGNSNGTVVSGTMSSKTPDQEGQSTQDVPADATPTDPNLATDQGDSASAQHFDSARSLLGLSDGQRRWEVVRRRPSKPSLSLPVSATTEGMPLDDNANDTLAEVAEDIISLGSSGESEKLGASHQDFFSMSIYHSKMDNEIDLDPVAAGLLVLSDLEKLFDIFFARINPLLTIFDPFLHSVTYVRNRSAFLTTVIAALAARLSSAERHAKLAVSLESHWRQKLLPEVLLGGYKSVEIAQAFLVLAVYHEPTNRMSEDRSWQYLGFAIRTATEIGINRLTQPNDEVKDNEQVRRRMRNRLRLWICLWLTDRSMSLQTGRPFTILEDDMIANSDLWHREPFAVPEDVRLVSLIKLIRVVTTYCHAFSTLISQQSIALQGLVAATEAVLQAQETIKSLILGRLQAMTEIERWNDIWCDEALNENNDGIQTLAISTFLDKWRPRAKIDLYYARLHLNSVVLEALERHCRFLEAASAEAPRRSVVAKAKTDVPQAEDTERPSEESKDVEQETARFSLQIDETKTMIDKVAMDCWETSLQMIDILLEEVPEEDLSAGPNALSVNVIYGALTALRLSNVSERHLRPWADRDAILKSCKALADALIKAGRTPEHRNGAAAPFGAYLKTIVMLWESENVGVSVKEEDDEMQSRASAANGGNAVDGGKEDGGESSKARSGPSSLSASANDTFGPGHQRSLTDPSHPSSPSANDQVPTTTTSSSLEQAMPAKQKYQNHSVGDDVWGGAFSSSHPRHPRRASQGEEDSASMDRMWDYLTTYPDPVSSFPMNLWQPQLSNSITKNNLISTNSSSAVTPGAANIANSFISVGTLAPEAHAGDLVNVNLPLTEGG